MLTKQAFHLPSQLFALQADPTDTLDELLFFLQFRREHEAASRVAVCKDCSCATLNDMRRV